MFKKEIHIFEQWKKTWQIMAFNSDKDEMVCHKHLQESPITT